MTSYGRVPTGSGKQGKQGKNNGQGKGRKKSGNFILGQKSGKSQGILFLTADCHANLLLFLSIIENVCHGIHQYESIHVNFKEFLYFSLFSSVTSRALNTIQISYGMSYFRHRDSSDIFTYDIARQSVVDKMVREISLEVREKSGKSQEISFSHFCGNPVWAR